MQYKKAKYNEIFTLRRIEMEPRTIEAYKQGPIRLGTKQWGKDMSKHYKFPNGCSQYGAQMGRADNITERNFPIKFRLFEIALDSGGYDNGGAYWGNGARLFYAFGDGKNEKQEYFCRAVDRNEAKQHVLYRFKNATFYR